ncbi:hypothetical protein ACKWTF_006543 [Chironomus riparius]
MDQRISNSRVVIIFIGVFKFCGLIIFEYPLKSFKISKIGLILILLNIILSSLYYYDRFVQFKEENLVNTKVLSSVIFFFAALDPTVKLLSLSILFFSQKHIFNIFKNIKVFNYKLLQISSFILDKHIWFPISFLIDVLLTLYEYGGWEIGLICETLLYMPMHFSILIILLIIKRLQSLEDVLR